MNNYIEQKVNAKEIRMEANILFVILHFAACTEKKLNWSESALVQIIQS